MTSNHFGSANWKNASILSFYRLRNFKQEAKTLLGISYLNGVQQTIIMFILPLYLIPLGWETSTIGWLGFVNRLAMAGSLIFFGYLGDRFGRRRMIIFGCSLSAIGLLLFLVSTEFYALILANVALGLSGASMMPNHTAKFADASSRKTSNYLFALASFIMGIGMTCGVLLAAIPSAMNLFGEFSMNTFLIVFLIIDILLIIRLLVATTLKVDTHFRKTVLPKSIRIILMFCSAGLVVGFAAGLVVPWFPAFFLLKFQVEQAGLSVAFAITNFLVGVIALAMPFIAEKTGDVRAIIATQASSIFVLLLIPWAPFFYIAIVLFSARMITMNIGNPITRSFIMKIVDKEDRSSALAYWASLWTLGWAFGYLTGGYVMKLDVNAFCYIGAVFYVIYVIAFYGIFLKYDEKIRGKVRVQS